MLVGGAEDRKRFVFNEWVRDSKGPYLTKPPPHGKRTTNGMIWGSSTNDFFWIRRLPGVDVMTIWSRSMIRQFGENVLHEEHDYEPDPRQLYPYPRLGLLVDKSHAVYVGVMDIAKYIQRHAADKNNKIGAESQSSELKGGNGVRGENGDISASNDSNRPTTMDIDSDEEDQIVKDSSASGDVVIARKQDETTVSESTDETLQSNGEVEGDDDEGEGEESSLEVRSSETIEPSQPTNASGVVTFPTDQVAGLSADAALSEANVGQEGDQEEPRNEHTQNTNKDYRPTIKGDDGRAYSQTSGEQNNESTDFSSLAMNVDESDAGIFYNDVCDSEAIVGLAAKVDEDKENDTKDATIDADDTKAQNIESNKEMKEQQIDINDLTLKNASMDVEDQETQNNESGNDIRRAESEPSDSVIYNATIGAGDFDLENGERNNVVRKKECEASDFCSNDIPMDAEDSEPQETGNDNNNEEGYVSDHRTSSDAKDAKERDIKQEEKDFIDPISQDALMDVEDSSTNDNERGNGIKGEIDAGALVNAQMGPKAKNDIEKDSCHNNLTVKDEQTNAEFAKAQEKRDDIEKKVDDADDAMMANAESDDTDSESESCSEDNESSEEEGLLDGLSENQYFIYKPLTEDFQDKPLQTEDESSEEEIGICARYRPSSLPKLEEKIPSEFFPDVLLVNDPDGVTYGRESQHWKTQMDGSCERQKSKPVKYKRRYPRPDMNSMEDLAKSTIRVANLDLSSAPLLGVGNHSRVHRGALRPPHPLVANTPTGELAVAAKVSFPYSSAIDLLQNEARIYNSFPEHLMEHWSGLNLVTPLQNPVPVGAVVPRFYGYYYPVDDENQIEDEDRGAADRMKSASRRWQRSPILLLEECGTPIEPQAFGPDDRSECFSLCLRLHYADFIQHSFYTRNILKQPGPLTEPQHLRSWSSPAFRVIDFGRGESWSSFQKGKSLNEASNEWWTMREHEKRKAERELEMTPFAYQ